MHLSPINSIFAYFPLISIEFEYVLSYSPGKWSSDRLVGIVGSVRDVKVELDSADGATLGQPKKVFLVNSKSIKSDCPH